MTPPAIPDQRNAHDTGHVKHVSKSGSMVTTRSKRGTLRSCGKSGCPAAACYPEPGR